MSSETSKSNANDRRHVFHRQGGVGLKWLVVVCLVMILSGAGALWLLDREAPDFRQVQVTQGRLGWEHDDGEDHLQIDRSRGRELWYRVMLDPAPVGQIMTLECEWVSPDGTIAHRNQYRTKSIRQSPWETHARWSPNAATVLGTWTVRLSCAGRELHSKRFEVVETNEAAAPVP